MDFARKQLEKYGWTDGKGLGRREDGIARPLQPRLKRSAAGVGHDPAAEHTDRWWSALYDAAAANVEVKGTDGNTREITTRDPDAVVISDKSWRIRKRRPEDEARGGGYMEHFVKTAVLTSGGARTDRLEAAESESDGESAARPLVSDEKLFAACGGRTAHKGARHGLQAKGKLARIEQQERDLLKLARYDGYSHANTAGLQADSNEKLTLEHGDSSEDTDSIVRKNKVTKKIKKNINEKVDVSQDVSKMDGKSNAQNAGHCYAKDNKRQKKSGENIRGENNCQINGFKEVCLSNESKTENNIPIATKRRKKSRKHSSVEEKVNEERIDVHDQKVFSVTENCAEHKNAPGKRQKKKKDKCISLEVKVDGDEDFGGDVQNACGTDDVKEKKKSKRKRESDVNLNQVTEDENAKGLNDSKEDCVYQRDFNESVDDLRNKISVQTHKKCRKNNKKVLAHDLNVDNAKNDQESEIYAKKSKKRNYQP